jgi:hypothetical protein
MSAVATSEPSASNLVPASSRARMSLGDVSVVALFAVIAALATSHHERWSDEAQAWLLARDSTIGEMFVRWMPYEGSPVLWHLLLKAAQALHLPYASISWISVALMIAGTWVWLRYAPFPRVFRYSFPFTYFMLYQYTVIARSYALLPVLLFTAAYLYCRKRTPVWPFTIVLILLANATFHGTMMALAFATLYLVRTLRSWSALDSDTRARFVTAALVFALCIGLLYVGLRPPDDSKGWHEYNESTLDRFERALNALVGAISGVEGLTAAIIAFAVVLSVELGNTLALVLFVIPVTAFIGFVFGGSYHHGTVLLAFTAAMWLGWDKLARGGELTPTARKVQRIFAIFVMTAVAIQVYWSFCSVYNDWRKPYSGSLAAAEYIKKMGADKQKIYSYHFHSVAILAYFDHNIFANQVYNGGKSFWIQSTGNLLDYVMPTVARDQPDWIILPHGIRGNIMPEARYISACGYSDAVRFTGQRFYKDGMLQPETYFIYHRLPGALSTPEARAKCDAAWQTLYKRRRIDYSNMPSATGP